MTRVVQLTGDHDTLPKAEFEALLGAPAQVLSPRQLTFTGQVNFARAASVHAWGQLWYHGQDTQSAIAAAIAPKLGDLEGSMAVVTARVGHDKPGNRHELVRSLGGAAQDAGLSIDLANPDHTIFAWFEDQNWTVGYLEGEADPQRFATSPKDRAHFSPISLPPRRALSLVNLAAVPDGGTVYDPFCGTGGILLEAARAGLQVMGSDLDNWMVQGTMQTLTDEGPEPFDGVVFQADIGEAPERVDAVDGIVTDLPYGRASGTDKEAVTQVYARALASFSKLLQPGQFAVIGLADMTALPAPEEYGFALDQVHPEYVHKSLTRHYVRLKRTGKVQAQ